MAWIPSYAAMGTHPKTKHLARDLGEPLLMTIGRLHTFWWWCMHYAKDGDLNEYDASDIADAAMWDGDPDILYQAMQANGFIDADNRVHNWDQYGGKVIKTKEANAERARNSQAKHQDLRASCAQSTEPVRASCALDKNREEENREEEITEESINSLPENPPTSEPKPNGAAKAATKQASTKEKPPKAPYTPLELYFCEQTGRVPHRLMPGERKQLQDCETKHGLTVGSRAVDWGVGNKITGIGRIIKAAETMAQNHGNGKHSAKPEPIRGIKVSSDTTVLWCPFCEKPELQCFCGDDVMEPWADVKCARMGSRIYATLQELEEIKQVGDPYKWVELQQAGQ